MDGKTKTSLTLDSLPLELQRMIVHSILPMPQGTFSELRDWHISDDKAERQKGCLSLLRTSKYWNSIAKPIVYANMTIHDEIKFWKPSFVPGTDDFVFTKYQTHVLSQFTNPYFVNHSLASPDFHQHTLIAQNYDDKEHQGYQALGRVAQALNESTELLIPKLQSISTGDPRNFREMELRLIHVSRDPETDQYRPFSAVFLEYLDAFLGSSRPESKNIRWYCFQSNGSYALPRLSSVTTMQHRFNGGIDLPNTVTHFEQDPRRQNPDEHEYDLDPLPTSGFLNGVTNRIHRYKECSWDDTIIKGFEAWALQLIDMNDHPDESRPLDGTIIDLSAMTFEEDLQNGFEVKASKMASPPKVFPEWWKEEVMRKCNEKLQATLQGSQWEGKVILRHGWTDT